MGSPKNHQEGNALSGTPEIAHGETGSLFKCNEIRLSTWELGGFKFEVQHLKPSKVDR